MSGDRYGLPPATAVSANKVAEQVRLLKEGIPCSALKDSDPDSKDPGCLDDATYFDGDTPWCDKHGPRAAPPRAINQSELNRLAQQLHNLREALKPFGHFAEALPPIIEGEPRLTDDGVMFNVYANMKNYNITCTDLRRAKALLDALTVEDYERMIHVTEQKMLGSPQEQLAALQKEVVALKDAEHAKMREEWEKEYEERKARTQAGGCAVRTDDGGETP